MAFDKFKSPRIPTAPKQYEFSYFNQLARTLDNFFTTIDSTAGMHMSSTRTISFKTPFKDVLVLAGLNNNLKIPDYTFLRVQDSGANFGFGGFINNDAIYDSSNVLTLAASDGQQLIVFNPTVHGMSIHNQEAATLAPARIITGTGATINNVLVASLIYSVSDARWVLISHQG